MKKYIRLSMVATTSNRYTIKSVSDEGTYYLVKDWRKNKALWVSKDNMDRHPEWWFTSAGKAKQSLKSLLSVMDDYLSDTFTVIDNSGNETPLDVKELGFDHIPDYEGDDIDACDNINGTTEPNAPDVDKTKLVRQVIKQAKEIRDYFQSHNNNLNRKQEQYLADLSDGIDNQSVMAIREAIEGLKYNSKNMRNEQFYLIEDLYNEFNFANGKFEGMGRPGSDDVDANTRVTAKHKMSKYNGVGYKTKANGKKYVPRPVLERNVLDMLEHNPDYMDLDFLDAQVITEEATEPELLAIYDGTMTPEEFRSLYDSILGIEASKDINCSIKPKYFANMVSASDTTEDDEADYKD